MLKKLKTLILEQKTYVYHMNGKVFQYKQWFQLTFSIHLKLTNFIPLVSFYSLWKRHKNSGFLMFSGGIERDQWHEMG